MGFTSFEPSLVGMLGGRIEGGPAVVLHPDRHFRPEPPAGAFFVPRFRHKARPCGRAGPVQPAIWISWPSQPRSRTRSTDRTAQLTIEPSNGCRAWPEAQRAPAARSPM